MIWAPWDSDGEAMHALALQAAVNGYYMHLNDCSRVPSSRWAQWHFGWAKGVNVTCNV